MLLWCRAHVSVTSYNGIELRCTKSKGAGFFWKEDVLESNII